MANYIKTIRFSVFRETWEDHLDNGGLRRHKSLIVFDLPAPLPAIWLEAGKDCNQADLSYCRYVLLFLENRDKIQRKCKLANLITPLLTIQSCEAMCFHFD